MLHRPPFPETLDNTTVNSFRSCPREAYLGHFQHYKPATQSVHLIAGGAFASGLEIARRAFYEQGLDEQTSIALGVQALWLHYGAFEPPEASYKTAERMAHALDYYFEIFPMATDAAKPKVMPSGRSAIEFSFAEPLEVTHPTTGQPLIYAGRSDMVVDMAQGVFIEDDKTASMLGNSWFNQWEMRGQFTGYTWAAQRSGLHVDGVLVRGISILKQGFGHAQHLTYRAAWEVERWYEQTNRDVQRMVNAWNEGYWDYNLGEACGAYGGCRFLPVCKSPQPLVWLESYFTRRKWDPITRTETDLPHLVIEQDDALPLGA